MAKDSTTGSSKRRIAVKNLPAQAKNLTAKGAKRVKGGELKSVMVTAVKSPDKSGRPTKLMEEEGIY